MEQVNGGSPNTEKINKFIFRWSFSRETEMREEKKQKKNERNFSGIIFSLVSSNIRFVATWIVLYNLLSYFIYLLVWHK